MFRYIVVTVVALVGIMSYVDGPSTQVEVARASTSPVQGFSLADLIVRPGAANAAAGSAMTGGEAMSEAEAVALAVAAGKEYRAGRKMDAPLRGLIAAVEAPADAATLAAAEASDADQDLWFVTGSAVNLRAGPGTSNGVVGRVTLGQEATVLSDPSAKWIEIRTATGESGWIFGKYLDDARPG